MALLFLQSHSDFLSTQSSLTQILQFISPSRLLVQCPQIIVYIQSSGVYIKVCIRISFIYSIKLFYGQQIRLTTI